MLTIRPFNNFDTHKIVDLWTARSALDPDFFTPLTPDLLEAQILGNTLFDAKGFLLACEDGKPVGFIHASFCPNASGTDLSPETGGILFAPIIHPDAPNRGETTKSLILAGENYLRQRGAKQWCAGGYGNAAPFYMGLYGRCNPEGILETETELLDIFAQLGYHPFERSRRFYRNLSETRPLITPKIQKVRRFYTVRKLETWTPSQWWDANIYRNFQSVEWNVFPINSSSRTPIAGALFHQIQQPLYSMIRKKQTSHFILDYIGVIEDHLREGVSTFLLTVVFLYLLSTVDTPLVIDTIVEENDERLIAFLLNNSFKEQPSVRSLYKIENQIK